MTLDRTPSTTSVIDVLDHVLDKGIVVDAWVRVSLAGIDLVTVEARVVVASIATYLNYATEISRREPVSWTGIDTDKARLISPAEQLRRIREQVDGNRFEPQQRRRAEDRLRDELRDARAKTIHRH